MHLKNVTASSPLVKAVDVLGDQGEAGLHPFERGEGPMHGGSARPGKPGPRRQLVKFPDDPGVSREGLGGGQAHGVAAPPEPADAPKGGDAALRRDPGARENRDPGGLPEQVGGPLKVGLGDGHGRPSLTSRGARPV